MGYLDAKSNALFKTAENGGLLFYPRGYWGKGYVLPDEETKTRIAGFIKKYMAIAIFVIFGSVVLLGSEISPLVWLPVLLTYYFIRLGRFTRDLPISEEKLTFRESITNSAKSDSLILLIFFFLSLVAMVSAYVLRLGIFEMIDYTNHPLEIAVTTWGGILCCAFFAWKIVINIREKQRVKNI
jgi:hypothetical protein